MTSRYILARIKGVQGEQDRGHHARMTGFVSFALRARHQGMTSLRRIFGVSFARYC